MAVKFFGQFLIQKGEISVDQLREALDLMESRNRSFCDMAAEKGLLTTEQAEALKSLESNTPTTASQAAVEEGYLTTEQVSDVLKAQQGARIRIGEALVELLRRTQLLEQLCRHRFAGLVMDGEPLQHVRHRKPVLVELGRQLDEVAAHRGARDPLDARRAAARVRRPQVHQGAAGRQGHDLRLRLRHVAR